MQLIIDVNESERLKGDQLTLYQSYVGTRPDLSCATGVLCKYMSKPANIHLQAAKRILRCIKSTVNTTLVYPKNGEAKIVIYGDADHAKCPNTSRSITGVCASVGEFLVSWHSYLQSRVATSTCEFEILAILDSVNEAE